MNRSVWSKSVLSWILLEGYDIYILQHPDCRSANPSIRTNSLCFWRVNCFVKPSAGIFAVGHHSILTLLALRHKLSLGDKVPSPMVSLFGDRIGFGLDWDSNFITHDPCDWSGTDILNPSAIKKENFFFFPYRPLNCVSEPMMVYIYMPELCLEAWFFVRQ